MVDQRKTIANNVYNDMAKAIRSNFALNMSEVGLEVKFRMARKSLVTGTVDINVKNGALDRLSGGERAKTMVSLIGALWDVQVIPPDHYSSGTTKDITLPRLTRLGLG